MRVRHMLPAALLALLLAAPALAIDINLGTYPETGEEVPANAAISDEWKSIGILFSARTADGPPGSLTPISGGWGSEDYERYLFYFPDVYGATAIFEFVDGPLDERVDASYFEIDPGFDWVGEVASLVGFDADGNLVEQVTLTGADPDIPLVLEGRFRMIEFRTQGNPGIGALSSTMHFELYSEVSAPATPAPALRLERPHPNPFNPSVTLAFSLERSAVATLAIHDLRGRRVATLARGEFAAGRHSLRWNGRDDAGRALPSGVYFARLASGAGEVSRKLVLIE